MTQSNTETKDASASDVEAPCYTPKFWFMRDNHTFAKIEGNSLKEIVENAKKLANKNPYGMVCPVIVTREGEIERRVGTSAHVGGDGTVDLSQWQSEILKDDVIKYYLCV